MGWLRLLRLYRLMSCFSLNLLVQMSLMGLLKLSRLFWAYIFEVVGVFKAVEIVEIWFRQLRFFRPSIRMIMLLRCLMLLMWLRLMG